MDGYGPVGHGRDEIIYGCVGKAASWRQDVLIFARAERPRSHLGSEDSHCTAGPILNAVVDPLLS